MSFELIIIEGVDEELSEAITYYEGKQTNLGRKFLDDWENTLDFLCINPLGFQTKYKDFRFIYFNRFPFLIVYKVEKLNIIIYRVVYAGKYPGKRFTKKD